MIRVDSLFERRLYLLEFDIREAGGGDLANLARLFDKYRIFYGKPSDIKRAQSFIDERLSKNDSAVFAAEKSNNLVGFTQLFKSFSSVSMQHIWILNDLYVDAVARRLGVASSLLERAEKFAIEDGAKSLTLKTAKDNLLAQALYEKRGWTKETNFYVYNFSKERI